MISFETYIIKQAYKRHQELGDKLSDVGSLMDWGAFRPITASCYNNLTERGGRPNIDCTVMLKLLVLQHWYGLSDPELERQVTDRLSFMSFLGFPETLPDYTTVWLFRERLIQSGKMEKVWSELQRQLDRKGLKVKRGTVQDATFITADPGHMSSDEPRGDDALTRRGRDGTWTKKGNRSYLEYKLHLKTDLRYGIIRAVEATTASVHDS